MDPQSRGFKMSLSITGDVVLMYWLEYCRNREESSSYDVKYKTVFGTDITSVGDKPA